MHLGMTVAFTDAGATYRWFDAGRTEGLTDGPLERKSREIHFLLSDGAKWQVDQYIW